MPNNGKVGGLDGTSRTGKGHSMGWDRMTNEIIGTIPLGQHEIQALSKVREYMCGERYEGDGKRGTGKVCMVDTFSREYIAIAMVVHPARCQLNSTGKKMDVFPCPRSRLRIWSRETGSVVPSRVSLLTLHTQAKSGAYSGDSSRFPRRRPHIK